MAITLDDLRGDRRRVRTERLVRVALTAAAGTSILISALIVFSLARETWTFVTQVEWATVYSSDGWFPRRGEYNIWTLLVGSAIVTTVAMVIAAPVGLGSAIYLSEYARPSVRKVLKPTLEILAGIPSVVLGFFAISVISPAGRAAVLRRHRPLQPDGRRHRRRHPLHPARRLGVGGRPAQRAPGPAGGELRHGRPQDHHHRPGGAPGGRVRAWWPPSSSPPPAPSARRWSCSSPAAPAAARSSASAPPSRASP